MTNVDVQLLTLGVVLVLNLIVLIMGFFTYKSVPQSAIQQILDAAEKTASRTQSGMDDEAVRLARSIVTLLQLAQPSQVESSTVPTPLDNVKKKTDTYHLTPLADYGAAVRDMPSSKAIEQWYFQPYKPTIVFCNTTPVEVDNDIWWFVSSGDKSGWVRASDINLTPVSISSEELANTIYGK